MIEQVGRLFGSSPPVGTGDMSLKYGGFWGTGATGVSWCKGHDGHQTGLEVDIRYLRIAAPHDDGLDIQDDPADYNCIATRILMGKIITICDVDLIYTNLTYLGFTAQDLEDDTGISVDLQTLPGHTNHFHVRLNNF